MDEKYINEERTSVEEMKTFKTINQIITSLENKTDRPLSFDEEEKAKAAKFFNTNNYFSFSIYRKLLPRIEGKEYRFTDALNLYKFNTFLRENINQFTGHIELMFKSTLIQQICTFYMEKKEENKIEIGINSVAVTIEDRKVELIKKINKTKNKNVTVQKLINETEKKLYGSIQSIIDTSINMVNKYAKEFVEILGSESESLVVELKCNIQKEAIMGIGKLSNIALELISEDLSIAEISMEDYQEIISEKKHVYESQFKQNLNSICEELLSKCTDFLQLNMHKFPVGECYLDLAIYKRDSEEELSEAKEVIKNFQEVINENSNKSDALAHYVKKQTGVPIWVIMDEVTFGNVYQFATKLDQEYFDAWVSNSFTSEYRDFILGWFRTVNFLRNSCAHYTRLYGRYFTVSPPSLLKEDTKKSGIKANDNKTLFANLLTIKNLLKFHSDGLDDWKVFVNNLEAEIGKNKDIIRISNMGFPENWKNCLIE